MSTKQRTILVVDDVPEDRWLVRDYLRQDEQHRYHILEAATGEQGLALCKTSKLDCLLLDYRLPDISGLEMLKTLTQEMKPAHYAIVLLTSIADMALATEAMKQGAHDCLSKTSLTPEVLQRALTYAIEKAALQRQVESQRRELLFKNQTLEAQVAALQRESTQRQRAEHAQLFSEQVTAAIIGSLTTQVALLNHEGMITAVNEAWLRFARENGGEAILDTLGVGINYLDVCRRAAASADNVSGAQEALEGLEAVLGGHQSLFTLEYPCHSPTQQHWYTLTITQLPIEPSGAVVSHLEITEQKLAQEALRLLETAVTQSNESILITTAEMELPGPQIVYVNPAFTKITGYQPEEVLGKTPRLLQGPKTDRTTLDRLRRQCLAGEIFHGEAINYRKDGAEFYLEWSIAPVRDAHNVITHFVATQFDATERKRAEAQLRQRTEELAQSNRELTLSNEELDAFAYVASHDLKEPLRGIHMYAYYLLESHSDKLDAEGMKMLNNLSNLTQRMDTLLDSLLRYARIGRQAITLHPVYLPTLLQEQLEFLGSRLRESGAMVRIKEPLPWVQADPVLLGEVFMNLLTNAMKYNDKVDKWIEIGCRDTPARAAPHRPAAELVFYVQDNGIGIAATRQADIFQIFRRLHGRNEYGGGVGAGLTIAKKIIERHGGRLWVESTPGEGSTFYFTLAPAPAQSATMTNNSVPPVQGEYGS
ncbi:MAG: PAS domain S-box protein [Caldilineaceae bacterium]